jgi:general secretion pathway protein G
MPRMSKPEFRMTKQFRISNNQLSLLQIFGIRHFVISSNFDIRASSFRAKRGFTILELLVVIAIIITLAGLILATTGYVQKKGARSRAEAEIAAMSAALESYKADNGIYPRDQSTSDALDPKTDGSTGATYQKASLFLYNSLSGATNGARAPASGAKSYFTFRPNMLSPADQTQNVQYIRDPFGNSYGYSTAYAADAQTNPGTTPTHGYNPTFDLWSTAGVTSGTDQSQWIKNW